MIRIIVDTTEGTEVEISRTKEILSNEEYFMNKLLEEGIEIIFLGEYSKAIAKANGCTISVGTNPYVITGRISRELAERL